MTHVDPMQFLYFSVLLLALIGWLFAEYRGRMGAAFRALMAWGMIFLARRRFTGCGAICATI